MNIRYAEILYSIGSDKETIEDIYLARKYYSHALTLENDSTVKVSTRALWGLLQTCKAIEHLIKRIDEKNTEIILTC